MTRYQTSTQRANISAMIAPKAGIRNGWLEVGEGNAQLVEDQTILRLRRASNSHHRIPAELGSVAGAGLREVYAG
jgi:hypothetical protein